eukprot:jgi/Psemu1/30097/gm1.30097_g
MSEHDVGNFHEDYRIMAQFEAALRLKDNTGFDMAEYKQRCQLIEEEKQQTEQQQQQQQQQQQNNTNNTTTTHTLPYFRKPSPRLPQTRNFKSGNSDGSSREPPLPFTRANRRYGKSSRNHRNDRCRVAELSPGVITVANANANNNNSSSNSSSYNDSSKNSLSLSLGSKSGSSSNISVGSGSGSDGPQRVVRCWGCDSGGMETYLSVNVLAAMVECPKCFTVSPTT